MASIRKTQTTNKVLFDTIRDLKKLSVKGNKKVFRAVAEKLSAPASQRVEVNLSKLERHVKEGERVIVPGKVLGSGTLTKKVGVIAFSFSETAKTKIVAAGGSAQELNEFMASKPSGSPRIIT